MSEYTGTRAEVINLVWNIAYVIAEDEQQTPQQTIAKIVALVHPITGLEAKSPQWELR